MKTLNCLRALFFRDIRTLFRSILLVELGAAFLCFFLLYVTRFEGLPYAVLVGPALCVPWRLMRENGGERVFPYPAWTVVLEKYCLGALAFLMGLALVVGAEQILHLLNMEPVRGKELFPIITILMFMVQLCSFSLVFVRYDRDKQEYNKLLQCLLLYVLLIVCGFLLFSNCKIRSSYVQAVIASIVLVARLSFKVSVRLYER